MFVYNRLIKCLCVLAVTAGITGRVQATPFTDSLRIKRISLLTYPDTRLAADTSACIIPFSRAGNLILIKAKADTTEGNFILDTGAPHLVLNITYFRDYPAVPVTDADQGGITTSAQGLTRTTVGQLSFGTFSYTKTEADLANLGNIENSKGVKILGLLGVQLFRQCEMFIDYEHNMIHLRRAGKKENFVHELLKDTAAYKVLPIEIIEDKIIVRTAFAGKKIRLAIDCGAETSILDSRLPNRILERVEVIRRIMLSGSGDQKVEALYGNIRNLTIGGESIDSLPVIITNLEKTCLSYISCIDGILGFDFLSLHKIGFNFVKRKMYIWK